jgi:RsiW-degrading membrane proteinase PrsW (M82 family)
VEGAAPFRITDVPVQFAAATSRRDRMADKASDNKNVLYLIIGVLVVAVAVLGFNLYQAKKQPEGLQINVGPDGLKIQNK